MCLDACTGAYMHQIIQDLSTSMCLINWTEPNLPGRKDPCYMNIPCRCWTAPYAKIGRTTPFTTDSHLHCFLFWCSHPSLSAFPAPFRTSKQRAWLVAIHVGVQDGGKIQAWYQHRIIQAALSVQEWWLYLRAQVASSKCKGFDSLFALISWQLWKERNARLFRGLNLNRQSYCKG